MKRLCLLSPRVIQRSILRLTFVLMVKEKESPVPFTHSTFPVVIGIDPFTSIGSLLIKTALPLSSITTSVLAYPPIGDVLLFFHNSSTDLTIRPLI